MIVDYSTWCGLLWNVDRVEEKHALAVKDGLDAANGQALSPLWADAERKIEMDDDPRLIEENLRRMHAAVRARIRR